METEKNRIRIVFIGGGLIGKERVKAVKQLIANGENIEIAGIYDPYINKKDFKDEFKISFFDKLDEVFKAKPTWAFIAAPHDINVELTKKFLEKGMNVLVEKPLGRNIKESYELVNSAKRENQLWVGFNYRFFEGISKALQDIHEKKFGKLISLNMTLGHGCHPEIKNSWKLDPIRAGGGCLIDPGVHLIDLCRIISNGKIKVKAGWKWDGFWSTGVEEEVHLLLKANGFLINLQISIVRWRSTFRMEINGEEGYGIVSGRNRSYGNQTYIRGKRWAWRSGISQKDAEELVVETDGNDSFIKEIGGLLFPDKKSFIRPCTGKEALENMNILEECRKIIKNKN